MVDSEDIIPLVKAAIFSVNAGLMTEDLFFLHCTEEKRMEIMEIVRITLCNTKAGFMKSGIYERMQDECTKNIHNPTKIFPLKYAVLAYKACQRGALFDLPELKIFHLHGLSGLDSDQPAIPVYPVLLPLLKGQ